MIGKFISKLLKNSYDWRNNKYRSIPSQVIGTLNFFARKNRSKKLASGWKKVNCKISKVNWWHYILFGLHPKEE